MIIYVHQKSFNSQDDCNAKWLSASRAAEGGCQRTSKASDAEAMTALYLSRMLKMFDKRNWNQNNTLSLKSLKYQIPISSLFGSGRHLSPDVS